MFSFLLKIDVDSLGKKSVKKYDPKRLVIEIYTRQTKTAHQTNNEGLNIRKFIINSLIADKQFYFLRLLLLGAVLFSWCFCYCFLLYLYIFL